MKIVSKLAPLALVAALALGGTAQAAFTVFTTQAAFNTATSAQGVDTYTGFSITGTTGSPITRTAGVYGYTGTAANDFFGAGTTANPWLSTNTATDSILFNGFTNTPNAIGGNFFGSDVAGAFAAGNITLTAVDSLGATSTQTITGATVTSFLGFVSTGNIVSLTVTSVQPTTGFLWPTVDNLTLAKRAAAGGVPEPMTWAMMIAGFGMVGASMRRRSGSVVAA